MDLGLAITYINYDCYVFQLSIDDISRYGDVYSAGSHSAALHNLRTAVEAANSSFVLPSVTSPTSGLVGFIRSSVHGKVVELQTPGKRQN